MSARRNSSALLIVLLLASVVCADDAQAPAVAPRPAGSSGPASPDQIAAWIKALGSDEYAARKQATQQLIDAGAAAVEAVAQAAESDDLELPMRCLSILGRLAESEVKETKLSALGALSKLAKSEREFLARRAGEALRAAAVSERVQEFANARRRGGGFAPPQGGFRGAPGGFGGGPGGFAPPPGGFGGRDQGRGAFGGFPQRLEATIEDGGKQVYIRIDVGQQVVLKVTETVNGQPKTTEYSAGSPTELRVRHPEAYELYRKHSTELFRQARQAGGGVQAAQLPARFLPANVVRVSHSHTDGRQTIRMTEGEKTTTIKELDGGRISVSITQPVDGQPVTSEFDVKDVAELKSQDPEAGRVYERYMPYRTRARADTRRAAAAGQPEAARQPETLEDARRDLDRMQRALDSTERIQHQLREQYDALRRSQQRQSEQTQRQQQKLDEIAAQLRKLAESAGGDEPSTKVAEELRRLANELDQPE